jgi:lipoate---protein ligase
VKLLDLTLPTPEENLACDEVLLDACDEGQINEVLRFWESGRHFVVVGYGNKVTIEVDVEACRKSGIPILRRCSGGGTVVQGPGCFNYSLVLRIDSDPALETVAGTNRFVMERNRAALESARPSSIRDPASGISVQGHTDLAIGNRKFSGNAQRRRKNAVLFHGSYLLNFDLELLDRLLPMPSKQPKYRNDRSHADFLINLDLTRHEIRTALSRAWKAGVPLEQVPMGRVKHLAMAQYASTSWNRRLGK